MIEFHGVTIEDKPWIQQRIASRELPTCEYTFGNIFAYSRMLDVKVADYEGFLLTKDYDKDFVTYCYPVGNGDIRKALDFIVDDGIRSDNEFLIFGLNDNDVKLLNEYFPGKFRIELTRDTFDYVYNRYDLAELKGRKYQAKRNHISFFKKNYNWSYERIDENNISECLEMSEQWLEKYESDHKEDLENELDIIRLFFDNFNALGCVGGLIRIDGNVVAYTLGEKVNDDIFCIHIEKAFSDIRGAYPMINQQFVLNELSDYKYIDREEDLGIENLRKAKLSYYPEILTEKYEAKFINDNKR